MREEKKEEERKGGGNGCTLIRDIIFLESIMNAEKEDNLKTDMTFPVSYSFFFFGYVDNV